MKKLSGALLILAACAAVLFAQPAAKAKDEKGAPPNAAAAAETAKAALAAHGGDKLRNLKTLVIRGSVGITTSSITQEIPATFAMVFAGEKYRFDLLNPFQPITQVSDGQTTTSNIQNGFDLPPINRLGFFMLSKIGDPHFPITVPPGTGKKRADFRITSPEGYYTDFIIEPKTGQIKGYESSYVVNEKTVTTSVEIDRFRLVDGILIPEKFAQRFDLGQFTAYANFKAKDISVNGEVDDGVFRIDR
jgi:hypothetical protein